ncbi:MAG: glycosyltransferase [Rhodospirillales bacterium]|nr:glycosyltransferase [Rhodospirillales bacterium]
MAPLIASVFATFALGGPQARFALLANSFGARYRHRIVAMDRRTEARERLAPALDIDFPAIDTAKRGTLANRARYRAALRDWRPDLLVTSNWGSIEWAMANRPRLVPHIHIEDGFGPEERARQLPRRVLTRRLVLARSQIVVPSATLYRIATETWRLDPARVRHIPNGIDLAAFRDAAPSALPFPPGTRVIGTVAALRPEKRLDRLLHALAALPDAALVIVGDGPERAPLAALAATLGLAGRVHFAGHSAAPGGFYRGFDLFALSSDTEQMPLSVIEAMAAGLPVAATDVGDVRAMLAHANAPFVTPRDPASLAAALGALLADRDLRTRLGAANRARAEAEFDQERMIAAYGALFDAAIGATGAARQA